MANLIIKPSTGAGNNLILQDQGGSAAVTIDDSGDATLADTLTVAGASTLTGNTTVGGTLGVTGNVTVANITASGTTTGFASPDVIKLYSTTISTGVGAINVNGYFDDSIYAFYKMMYMSMKSDVASGNPYLRVMTGGSVDSSSLYCTSLGENFNNSSGGVGTQDRAQDNAGSSAHLNATWSVPRDTYTLWDYELTFASPQSTTNYKHFRGNYVQGGDAASTGTQIVGAGIVVWEGTTALTGISVFSGGSGAVWVEGTATLWGYKK